MIEKVISVGYGLIVKTDEAENYECTLDKRAFQIGRTLLEVGKTTDLDNFFSKQLRFCGFQEDYAVFHLGTNKKASDLFTPASEVAYYELILMVTETRFFCHYHKNGGRDYNFINGCWDCEKKNKGRRRERKTAKTS